MCGIAGFVSEQHHRGSALADSVGLMARALATRGPDDEGVWVDEADGVALGHRRLAIIDLSSLGHQPMASECGRYEMSFNGEIYNFAELRADLTTRGHSFRGQSDTEVMLAAFNEWGVPDAVPRFAGMFAAGVWDRRDKTLHLLRDRLGEKPLYYGWIRGAFVFASELKALRAHPDFDRPVDRNALGQFMRYGYVPAPHSIYQQIYKLPAGCRLTATPALLTRRESFSPFAESADAAVHRPQRYWSLRREVEDGVAHPFSGSADAAADQLDTLLTEAVGRQMVSDVPIGALLSGGVDSSTIAALMRRNSAAPIRTFAIGFDDPNFDESAHARAVARHLGTEHTELCVTAQDALDVVGRLPAIYDEPFADASQIPTVLLCALIRRHVTVALSGDGGDELFGGYNRYVVGHSIWSKVSRVPAFGRRWASRILRAPGPDRWDRLAGRLEFIGRRYGTQGTFGDKFDKLADVLAMENADALYQRLVSFWRPNEIVIGLDGDPGPAFEPSSTIPNDDVAARMMFADLMTYLPDDILAKVDRASMASSLEVRVPLLDHRVVEFACRLPTHMKIDRQVTKRVLRDVLYRYVPRELIERPKMGFGVPLGDWLRGPLREWATELLDDRRMRAEGLLQSTRVQSMWAEHLAGRRNWQNQLWCVLTFQAWSRAH